MCTPVDCPSVPINFINVILQLLKLFGCLFVSVEVDEIKIQEKLVTILNIYGPDKDEIDIILELFIATHEGKNFVIREDFKYVLKRVSSGSKDCTHEGKHFVIEEDFKYVLKRVSSGSKNCTKELKLECAYFLGQIYI